MLLAAATLDVVFQPIFQIGEEPCTTTRNKNNLEENVARPGSAYEQTRGDVKLLYILRVINLVLL